MKRISIFLVGLLAIGLVACSSDQGSSSAIEEATPEASESAEPSGSAGAEESETAIPSFDMADFDCTGSPLADRLPEAIGGETLTTVCMTGDFVAMGAAEDPAFMTFLNDIGADPSDVSMAIGGTDNGELAVVAFRIEGVPQDTLEEKFLTANQAQDEIGDVERATIAGKDVWTATSNDPQTPGTAYIYAKDDTVYLVMAPSDDAASSVLEALP